MGFKYFLYGGTSGNTRDNPATNNCVFATADEAERAHAELANRWWGAPPCRDVREVPDEPNYIFPAGTSRPQYIDKEASHAGH